MSSCSTSLLYLWNIAYLIVPVLYHHVFSQAYQGPLRLVSLLRANFNFTTVTVLTTGHGSHSTTQKKVIRQVAHQKKQVELMKQVPGAPIFGTLLIYRG